LRRLVIDPAAREDLRKVRRYLETQRTGKGREFLSAAWDQLQNLVKLPFSAPVVEAGVRKASMSNFSYDIFYLVSDEELVVFGVIHHRRHPDTWKKRI
jgi:toxin ParE1/3/4